MGGQQFFHLAAELSVPAASLVQISGTVGLAGQLQNGQKDLFFRHGEHPSSFWSAALFRRCFCYLFLKKTTNESGGKAPHSKKSKTLLSPNARFRPKVCH